MAAQIRLLFLLFVSVLSATGFASSLDFPNDNEPALLKTSANVSEIFDSVLPLIRSFILNSGLDPMKQKDMYINMISLKGKLNLTDGWLKGLSDVKRVHDVILSYEDQVLTLDATVIFDVLNLNYTYSYKDLLIKRNGRIHGIFNDVEMRTIIGVDTKNYRVDLLSNKIVNLKPTIKLEGSKLDPIINAITKAITPLIRKYLASTVEKEFTNMLEAYVKKINGRIPQPNGNNTSAYERLSVYDFIVTSA